MNREEDMPFAVRRLSSMSTNRIITESEQNIDVALGNYPFKDCTIDGKPVASKMPLGLFQNRLIKYFEMQFKKNAIVWSSRIKIPSVY